MLTKPPNEINREIGKFILSGNVTSYMELETYAFDNDKHDWLWLLKHYRKYRQHFGYVFQGIRQKGMKNYKNDYLTALEPEP